MRSLMCALAIATFGAASTLAQDVQTDTRSRTTIAVEDGKDVTVTGCVARSAEGNFTLTDATGKEGAIGSYMLVADGRERDRLEEHLGHRVEIRGRAADQGNGKLTMRNETEVRTSEGERRKRESKTTVRGDLEGLPFLGVRSVRMLATVCP